MDDDAIRIPAGGEAEQGGPVLPTPLTAEDVAAATDGSLAGKMRARLADIRSRSTKEFPVPGWDGDLIVVARPFRDAKAYRRGVKNEVFIARATKSLIYVDDDGERHEIPGGWGKGLAGLLGLPVEKVADLIGAVLDNPVRLDSFAGELLIWMQGRLAEDEQDLGE